MNKSTSKLAKINIVLAAVLAALLILLLVLVVTNQKDSQNDNKQEVFPATEATATTATVEETADQENELQPENTATLPEATEEVTEPEVNAPEAGSLSYGEYLESPVDMQQADYENFESPEDFFEWMDTAKEEYEESISPDETLPDGITVEEGGIEEWE